MQWTVAGGFRAGWMVSGLVLTVCGEQALAAGFALRAQSATSVGTAGASDFAGTGDVSAMFSNPAALSAFKGQNVSVGGSYIMPKAEFKDGKRTIGTTGVEAVTDDSSAKKSDDFGSSSFIPALYGSYEINDSITAGLGLSVPYGTKTDYGNDWVGRYHGTKTELTVTNLDLAASYKLMENLKLGFGIQVQHAKGLISGASNAGALGYQMTGETAAGLIKAYYTAAATAKASPTADHAKAMDDAKTAMNNDTLAKAWNTEVEKALAANPTANATTTLVSTLTTLSTQYFAQTIVPNEGKDDAYAKYEGSDIAYGFTLGALYSPLPELDLGFSYRSPVVHKTDGDFSLSGETAFADVVIAKAFPGETKRDAKLNIGLPDVIGLGAVYKGVTDLQLFASASLTRWSKIRDINVRPEGLPDVMVLLNWEDVWAVGIGASYKISEWTVRGGVASDNSPTTDDLRSPRSPDDNRKIIALGGRYEGTGWSVDAGLLHAIFRDPTLDLKADAYDEAKTRGDLSGTYKVSADTFTVQYNMTM